MLDLWETSWSKLNTNALLSIGVGLTVSSRRAVSAAA